MPKIMHEFDLHTVHSKKYRTVKVRVYKTRKKMAEAVKKAGHKRPSKGVQGLCLSQTTQYKGYKNKTLVDEPYISLIYLNLNDLMIDVISHELMHAVWYIYYTDLATTKKKRNNVDRWDEYIAYLYGDLMEQLYQEIKQLNILK